MLKAGERPRRDLAQDSVEIDMLEARMIGQSARARTRHQVADLDGAKAHVDRNGAGAQPGAGQEQVHIGQAVGQP